MALTRQQIVDAVDQKLATLWAGIQTREATYAANHGGTFWQGLRLFQTAPIPADGNTATPDVGTAVPSYMDPGDSWPAVIRNNAQPMSLEIHQYVCPDGTAGYQAFVTVTILGQTWQRSAQVGPETWRASPWTQIVAIP